MEIDFDHKLFNPNFHHAMQYICNKKYRYCFFYGGSSSSKTYSIVQAILLTTLDDGRNSLIFRKVQASIKKTIYNDFVEIIDKLQLQKFFKVLNYQIKCINGAKIDFLGLDDPEKVKGISTYKRIMVDEITELELSDFKQLRKRMRGIENQKLIATFNPVDEGHWLKKQLIDNLNLSQMSNSIDTIENSEVAEVNECENYVFVRSTYLNNYYVVGSKCGTYGYVDQHTIDDFNMDKLLDPNFYNIYALGMWGNLINGSEYYKQFRRDKHVQNVCINEDLPLHISFDENVRPYLPMTVIQTYDNKIVVVDEIIGRSPYNNINDLCKLFAEKYSNFKNKKIYIYGDATSRRNDARTEEGYNLFGMIVSELEEKYGFNDINVRVSDSNPSVSMSGRFINNILVGLTPYQFIINETCIETINDFLYLKEDKAGGIMKERVKDKTNGTTYEKYGHLSDTCRYMIIRYLENEYNKFIGRDVEFECFDWSDENIMAF